MAINDLVYQEELSSNRTEVLFLTLMVLFLLLFVWRIRASGEDIVSYSTSWSIPG